MQFYLNFNTFYLDFNFIFRFDLHEFLLDNFLF